jgi:hypothetical protein
MAAVVADKDEIGGRYLEDCAVARLDGTLNPFADDARAYALDADRMLIDGTGPHE